MDINNPAPITVSSVEKDDCNSPLDAWIQSNSVDTQAEVDKADLISIFTLIAIQCLTTICSI